MFEWVFFDERRLAEQSNIKAVAGNCQIAVLVLTRLKKSIEEK